MTEPELEESEPLDEESELLDEESELLDEESEPLDWELAEPPDADAAEPDGPADPLVPSDPPEVGPPDPLQHYASASIGGGKAGKIVSSRPFLSY